MSDTEPSPPIPAPAATVILVRQKGDRLQVYLLRRNPKSGFMPGKYVFPGGMVDPEDQDTGGWVNHVDLDTARIARRLGRTLSYQQVLPYCVAAIRETFEEAGVLLRTNDTRPNSTLDRLLALRKENSLPCGWLKEAALKGWTLSMSRLSCWSHWITPERMKRRFDTRFFIAEMPAKQECRPDNQETTHGVWVTPAEALAGNLEGRIPLSPPTLVTLHELLRFPGMEDLKVETARRNWGTPIMPRLIPREDGSIILEPWDPMYRQKKAAIGIESPANHLLAVGESFSRLWHYEYIWRPVSNLVSNTPDEVH